MYFTDQIVRISKGLTNQLNLKDMVEQKVNVINRRFNKASHR